MICEKCGHEMRRGYAKASATRGRNILPPTVTLEFNIGYIEIETQEIEVHDGWYCKDCGKFTLTFDVEKDVEIEDPLDDLWDEDTSAVKVCPQCGEIVEQEFPQCPHCRYHFSGMFPFV